MLSGMDLNCTLCGLREQALVHHADVNGHRFETLCLAETMEKNPPYRIYRCGLPKGHDGIHVSSAPRYSTITHQESRLV